MLARGIVIVLGAAACAAVPSVIERLFTQQQMANSSLPLLIDLAVPFLVSLLVVALLPASGKLTAAWIALAAVAFLAGDAYAIFHFRRGDSNLWPVELAISSALVAAALIGGAALGNAIRKRAQVA